MPAPVLLNGLVVVVAIDVVVGLVVVRLAVVIFCFVFLACLMFTLLLDPRHRRSLPHQDLLQDTPASRPMSFQRNDCEPFSKEARLVALFYYYCVLLFPFRFIATIRVFFYS